MSTLKITATQDNTELAGLCLRDTNNGSELTLVLPGEKKFQVSVENEDSGKQKLFYVDTEGNEIGYSSDKPILATLPKIKVNWHGSKSWLGICLNRLWSVAWPVIKPWARRIVTHVLSNLDISLTYPEKDAVLHAKTDFLGTKSAFDGGSKHGDLTITIHGSKLLEAVVALADARTADPKDIAMAMRSAITSTGCCNDMQCEFHLEGSGAVVDVNADFRDVLFSEDRVSGKKLFVDIDGKADGAALLAGKTDLADFDLDATGLSRDIMDNLSK